MDLPRKISRTKKILRWAVPLACILIAVPALTIWLSRLKPAAPLVERSSVWIDETKRGEMLRQVRGLGTLIPEETLLIPATTDGWVDRIRVRPGAAVKPDTIILDLSNAELETAALDMQFQVKAAEAAYTDLKVQLESKGLDQKAVAAQVGAEYSSAKLKADRDQKLATEGLIPDLDMKLSTVKAQELATRVELEQKRLDITSESVQAQLAAARVKVDQMRAQYELKKRQVDALKVRAGAEGILQQLPVEVGQRIPAGTVLAKVAQPGKLKAELKIAETQAKDIVLGQPATIDTRNGIIPGTVVRIDPAVQNGTVTVDVKLDGALPQGARPDLSVDGTIELEHLQNVLYVGRPVFGQPNSTIALFRLDAEGKEAGRIQVKLGRSSVNTMEVLEGLREGDRVILSDMSAWDAQERIRLN